MTPERWQQIEKLCYEALELDSERRSAFLSRLSASNEELGREVKSMIAAHDRAGDFLQQNAMEIEAEAWVQEGALEKTRPLPVQNFSHYRILSRIGAGGMGEVWLARDNNLDRNVALKFLPTQFTHDRDRLQRFVREAKAASALNHPNIITIHEIGEAETAEGKTHFIATEFIEGPTLRQVLASEELSLKKALDIAIQAAAALDAAHHVGIVHRDIKPENIMIRPDGLVKVLDFGLAKLAVRRALPEDSPDDWVDTSAKTLPEVVKTQPGMILGTLRYMSPEQARGREVDARTDIFSLGVVLYEMIAKQPLFAGETSADVIAAIIHKEPYPLSDYDPGIPPELERIVGKALAKECRDRYQTARDLQIDLQTLKQESEISARLHRSGERNKSPASGKLSTYNSGQLTRPRFTFKQILLALPVVALLAVAIWWFGFRLSGQVQIPPPGVLKTIKIDTWPSAPGEGNAQGAFSPDGRWVAFTSTKGGSKNIWIKQATAMGDARSSTQDEFLNLNPIWSPNGEEIAFVSRRSKEYGIWRKPIFGDTPTLIKAQRVFQLCRWSKNGATIYYEVDNNLFSLDVNSGETRQLTHLDSGKNIVEWFSLSLDEKRIAYLSSNAQGQSDVWTMPLAGGSPRRIASLFTEARNTAWHPDNHRVFFSARESGTYQIFVADLDGHIPAQLTFGDRDSFVMDVSVDGARVLSGSSDEESDIWKVDVASAKETSITSDIDFEFWPDVSANGQMIAYEALRNFSQGNNSNSSIMVKTIGSTDKPSLLANEGRRVKWSPNGNWLAFMHNAGGVLSLEVANLSERKSKPLVGGGLNVIETISFPYNRNQSNTFDWSPDSLKLVFGLTVKGQTNLWMAAVDGSGNVQLTSQNDPNLGIDNPFWSSDSKRITYLSRTKSPDKSGKFGYGVWVLDVETQKSEAIFRGAKAMRLLGWSANQQEFIVALFNASTGLGQSEVELFRVDAKTGKQIPIAVLPSAYRGNIHLSADKRTIAFTSHLEGEDNVWLLPVSGGQAKKLTRNNDPNLYFSSLTWSSDSRAIYFGKQTRHGLFSMITNLE